jgi:hypothetical protein
LCLLYPSPLDLQNNCKDGAESPPMPSFPWCLTTWVDMVHLSQWAALIYIGQLRSTPYSGFLSTHLISLLQNSIQNSTVCLITMCAPALLAEPLFI